MILLYIKTKVETQSTIENFSISKSKVNFNKFL